MMSSHANHMQYDSDNLKGWIVGHLRNPLFITRYVSLWGLLYKCP